MLVEICSDTDPGLARANNEDSVTYDAATRLCILADGMGGHNAGEIASGMATAFIKAELGRWIARAGAVRNAGDLEAAMAQVIADANRAIYNMSRTTPQYSGMGTTLVVGVFRDDGLVLGHIGDSRCYRLRDGQLQQITKDHSLLQEQVDTGLVMPDQTLPPVYGNFVTRAVGVNESVHADIARHLVMPGDLYLLCSDGLSDMVSEENVAAILRREDAALAEKARQLIRAANDEGGRDNISVLLAQVREAPGKSGLLHSARRTIHGVWQGFRRN
ncbi:MAG TPA: Stp1/IreP family PP2C-type Ser/Thr phosphatase [Paucimonas sp.]|nr:Stp1/IreP family PP2C-type Ser/Thr phosphatase [Paucimonas sp.]